VLGTAALSFALAQTSLIPAIGDLMTTFHTDASGVAWTLTGYLASAAVFTPVFGRLGDMLGKKRMLVIALALFALGNLLSGIGNSLEVVVLETRRPSLGPVERVQVVLRSATGDELTRSGVPGADGSVVLDPVDLASPGSMTADITVDRPAAPVASVHLDWTVDRVPVARATTKVSDGQIAGKANLLAVACIALGGGWTVRRGRGRRSRTRQEHDPSNTDKGVRPMVVEQHELELV